MITSDSDRDTSWPGDDVRFLEEAMVELSLLLPERQFEALSQAALCQNMTVGQLLRRLVSEFVGDADAAAG
jgi:hypothetical protein